jgi:erythromycin esterase-like protein
MSDFLPDRDCQIIVQMRRAVKTLPDDFWAVAVVQNLAGFLARNEGQLSDDDWALLIGVGAFVSQQADTEMTAEIQMKLAMARAKLT